jgi:3-hydroxy acid dehydrogenase/malonic semialdehyde reductase
LENPRPSSLLAPNANLRLIVTARRLESLEELAAQIRKETNEGVKVLPVKLDVSKADEIRGFVGNLPEEWRDIHVLVNNAYVYISLFIYVLL